ncbi:hypothetical protein A0J61_02619 [Choanephora cucurbitarum]|uniref:Uncharacterized protein n=1 Tax=Choanephora cucurbitarum TaxID=101091 RepID=A0A1C7NK06_9FUNG|nr:hypothetical protein A0J61_02619 [Choanephora cucurbitarum]
MHSDTIIQIKNELRCNVRTSRYLPHQKDAIQVTWLSIEGSLGVLHTLEMCTIATWTNNEFCHLSLDVVSEPKGCSLWQRKPGQVH